MILLLTLIFILSFLIVISALVFFHELGHYSVARLFGVAVERFSIGFGKPIWRRRAKSGTEWVIASIPLGGYVKFLGDAGAASNPDHDKLSEMRAELDAKHGIGFSKNCFHFKPLWQRALIVAAGPIANFLLAILIFAGLVIGRETYYVEPIVQSVAQDSPAAIAGFEPGDRIVKMNNKEIESFNDVQVMVMLRKGTEIVTEVQRGSQILTLNVTPEVAIIEDQIGGKSEVGRIGLSVSTENMVTKRHGPLSALGFGVERVGGTIGATGTYIGRIFTGKEDGKQLGGIVRIATMTGKTATDTVQLEATVGERLAEMAVRLAALAAALSIGLGVANLMPIPVLDGGHLVLYGYEAVAGKPLSERGQDIAFRFGISILLGLFVILTWNDIGYVRSIFS